MRKIVVFLVLLVQLVLGLDNGLARLPPMGWMSWSRFFCEIDCDNHPNACINEDLYKGQADRLVSDGFKAVGYTHIHIDDCWSEMSRDAEGRLVPDKKRFSSGIPSLVDYMHKKGLKLGIYGDVGTQTCAKYPASQGKEEVDAKTFASWNVDYLKFDGCNALIPDLRENYVKFGKFLNATGAKIIYSCEWPLYEHEHQMGSNYTAISQTCNLFRNYHDVANSWDSVLDIIKYYVENQEQYIPYHGPGSWFDPDMLVIGNNLSEAESRTQMGVWSIWSAPLIMSNDLRDLAKNLRAILQNKAVIAVDQDPLGIMGRMVASKGDIYIFIKPMTPFIGAANARLESKSFSYAILVMNKGESLTKVTFKFSDLGLSHNAGYTLDDLWSGKKARTYKPDDKYKLNVAPHDSAMFKATVVKNGAQSAFSSLTLLLSTTLSLLLLTWTSSKDFTL